RVLHDLPRRVPRGGGEAAVGGGGDDVARPDRGVAPRDDTEEVTRGVSRRAPAVVGARPGAVSSRRRNGADVRDPRDSGVSISARLGPLPTGNGLQITDSRSHRDVDTEITAEPPRGVVVAGALFFWCSSSFPPRRGASRGPRSMGASRMSR